MPRSYTPEFKKKIVRLHLDEGRTYKSITAEYGVSKASISAWCSEFSKECQAKAIADPETKNEAELMKENRRLRKELEESRKEMRRMFGLRTINPSRDSQGVRMMSEEMVCRNATRPFSHAKQKSSKYTAKKHGASEDVP